MSQQGQNIRVLYVRGLLKQEKKLYKAKADMVFSITKTVIATGFRGVYSTNLNEGETMNPVEQLKQYLKYCERKNKRRCGTYRDAVQDCIDILQKGETALRRIKERDSHK